jgi:type II secretory pathway pseudopilin PulG
VTRATGFPPATTRGAVLLEVLLALMLFAVTAAIITSSMNASMDGLERLKLNTHAANLASTLFAELELSLRAADASGEQALEKPFDAWTYELGRTGAENESGEASGLTQIEVILRHKDSELVYRQMQWLKLPEVKAAAEGAALTVGTGGPNP